MRFASQFSAWAGCLVSCAVLSFGCADDGSGVTGGEPIDTDGTGGESSTGSDPTAPNPTGISTGVTTDPTGPDDTGGCGGCLNAVGACVDGGEDAECGVLGEACVACEGGQQCDEGICVDPPACGPDNCDGCCDGDSCVAGDAASACGAGGGQCSMCPSGASCDAGICNLACEDACGGCCDGDTCVSTDEQGPQGCGIDGNSCEACPEGFACNEGECISTACAASCDGCCDGDTCLDGDASGACGAGGATCQACGTNLSCGDAGCEPDDMALWDVSVIEGVVPLTDADGDAWDSFGGLPDPYVTMSVIGQSGETAAIDNELFPEWNELVLTAVNTVQIEGGLEISVVDSDSIFDETIGTCLLNTADPVFDASSVISCETEEGFELWELTITIAPSAG